MISVRIPYDKDFEYKKCRSMYRKYQKKIGDDQAFKDIIADDFFYSFYIDDELIGAIYCFLRNENLFLNGFGTRGHHEENIICMKRVLSWFNCDIYAESIRKPAILCLLRAGFKKFKDNTYIYKNKGG